jgi:alkylation response protein AidB-like acyl-CoA dehydrogenase
MTKGVLNMGEASAAKVFGTELAPLVARQLLEVLDHNGLRRGPDAPLRGALESAYRVAVISTFGGGANEIQRDIIAMAGLGMPRAPRDLRPTCECAGEKPGGSIQ